MKKLLGACVLLGVGVVLGRLFDGVPRASAVGGPGGGAVPVEAVPVGNGDVNGDGTIDITDAVYLLANLFTGGPAVKPIECPAAPQQAGLPDTGQTACWSIVENQGQSTATDRIDWCGSLAYCEDLSFAGHDDWRLPNVRELQSIVDYGRHGPAIDPVFGALSSRYWSSTSRAASPAGAWLVDFDDGYVDDDGGVLDGNVRAARRGP